MQNMKTIWIKIACLSWIIQPTIRHYNSNTNHWHETCVGLKIRIWQYMQNDFMFSSDFMVSWMIWFPSSVYCKQFSDCLGLIPPSSHPPILPSSHPPILPSSHPPILPSSHPPILPSPPPMSILNLSRLSSSRDSSTDTHRLQPLAWDALCTRQVALLCCTVLYCTVMYCGELWWTVL